MPQLLQGSISCFAPGTFKEIENNFSPYLWLTIHRRHKQITQTAQWVFRDNSPACNKLHNTSYNSGNNCEHITLLTFFCLVHSWGVFFPPGIVFFFNPCTSLNMIFILTVLVHKQHLCISFSVTATTFLLRALTILCGSSRGAQITHGRVEASIWTGSDRVNGNERQTWRMRIDWYTYR